MSITLRFLFVSDVQRMLQHQAVATQADLRAIHSSIADLQARMKRDWNYMKMAMLVSVISIIIFALADKL